MDLFDPIKDFTAAFGCALLATNDLRGHCKRYDMFLLLTVRAVSGGWREVRQCQIKSFFRNWPQHTLNNGLRRLAANGFLNRNVVSRREVWYTISEKGEDLIKDIESLSRRYLKKYAR
ncbi:MAG: winged helix-turn-helix transcriptional regulator [Bacteroidetes bacterium]|nr:winged helix-turn-helix transcriptional regulator [Bacteroidota bacterium]